MNKILTQVIVNTKGQSITLKQERDILGRFTGKADVARQLDAGLSVVTAPVETPLVVVHYGYNHASNEQVVSVMNRETGSHNFKSYLNDGSAGPSGVLTLL